MSSVTSVLLPGGDSIRLTQSECVLRLCTVCALMALGIFNYGVAYILSNVYVLFMFIIWCHQCLWLCFCYFSFVWIKKKRLYFVTHLLHCALVNSHPVTEDQQNLSCGLTSIVSPPPENCYLLGYLSWILQKGGLSVTGLRAQDSHRVRPGTKASYHQSPGVYSVHPRARSESVPYKYIDDGSSLHHQIFTFFAVHVRLFGCFGPIQKSPSSNVPN